MFTAIPNSMTNAYFFCTGTPRISVSLHRCDLYRMWEKGHTSFSSEYAPRGFLVPGVPLCFYTLLEIMIADSNLICNARVNV